MADVAPPETTATEPAATDATSTTVPTLVTVAPTTTSAVASPSTSTTTDAGSEVRHVFPVLPPEPVGYQNEYSSYPATDLFQDCGSTVVSPTDGVIDELRRFDPWDPAVDDPGTRGGIFVSIIGDDGVRYYLAHLQVIVELLDVGMRITAGSPLGELGMTGRVGACHTHLSLSPPCATDEWWVRRGVISPFQYLREWEAGNNASPVLEVLRWSLDHPDACTTAP